MRNVIVLLTTVFSGTSMLQGQNILAGEVVEKIRDHVQTEWRAETVDTFKSGDATSKVTGIATTFLANLDVLQRAHARGLNMIITHEPIFYNHLDDTTRFIDDPVLEAKKQFIEENDLVIWRFHDHWHLTEPDGIYEGVVRKLSWAEYKLEDRLFKLPPTTVGELVKFLRLTLDARTIRVVGNPQMEVSNVALVLGAPGSMAQIEMLAREDVEVLVGGETPEWETVEYVRDANSAGMNKSLILVGHALSEEPGMDYCAEWMRTFISEVPVEFVPAREPFWSPGNE